MNSRCLVVVLFLYTTTVVATTKDYYHPNEDPDRLILWKGLFTKINTLMVEIEKVNQNLLEVKNSQINKLQEAADFNTKYLREYKERQEDQANQIIKLLEAADFSTKYLMESKERQFDLMEKPFPQWTTILRRQDGSVDFYRNWTEYQNGFGNPPYGEFFLGLDRLHAMTTNSPHELVVVLKDWKNETATAHYDLFEIGGEDDQYTLNKLGTYSGNAWDSLEIHKGVKFSTVDKDNDKWENGNCAKERIGAWWFTDCDHSHLAGPYRNENEANLKGVKIRPKDH